MTSLAVPVARGVRNPRDAATPSRADVAEHVAVAAMLLFWAIPFAVASGGAGVHAELLFAAVLVPIVVVARAWRAPTGSVIAAAIVAAAALVVCVVSPTGWWGSNVATGYVISAAVYVVARRYARDARRTNSIAAAICLAGIFEFGQGLSSWLATRSPSAVMSGNFEWHNPFAAFLLPGAVVGTGLAAWHRRPWSVLGAASAVLCSAGVVLSTSRATLAVLAVAWVVMFAGHIRDRIAFVRLVGVFLIAVAVTFLLPGPPFFSHRVSPLSGASARAQSGQTLGQNGSVRLDFWREAAAVAMHQPVVGSGFHGLGTASALYTPINWVHKEVAFDGYLQPLSDGGLLLGVPFLFGVAVIAFWALRRFLSLIRSRSGSPDRSVTLALSVALLGAFAHSVVDYDWSDPATMAEVALIAACLAPAISGKAAGRVFPRSGLRRLTVVAVVVLIGSLAVCVPALHQWRRDDTPTGRAPTSQSATALLAAADAPFGDARPAETLLQGVSAGTLDASTAQVAEALRLTGRQSQIDLNLALLRDIIGARFHLTPDGVAVAEHVLQGARGNRLPYVIDWGASSPVAAQRAVTKSVLQADIGAQVAAGSASPRLASEIRLWAQAFGRGPSYGCELASAGQMLPIATARALPRPRATCAT